MPAAPQRHHRPAESTSEQLLQAAVKEFNEQGFSGTDTNKIARRAGFSPQTFYRWFQDKVEIFIQVYERWQQEELVILRRLMAEGASDLRLAQAVAAQHAAYLVFRRSLRLLSLENDGVRAARARARLNQIAYLKSLRPGVPRDEASMAVLLLQTERLADALAEGEFKDMGFAKRTAEEALARLIHQLRTGEPAA
jgi:AcrR family transcriptional regulator